MHDCMGSFDSVAASLREAATPLRMTVFEEVSKLIHHFLSLLVHRNGKRFKRRSIHGHRNPLHAVSVGA